MKQLLFRWLPRIFAIIFIFFISLFALDVFNKPNWPLALFLHLIPSFSLLFITIIAWKNRLFGGALFILASLILFFFTSLKTPILLVPSIIIGLLYLLSAVI